MPLEHEIPAPGTTTIRLLLTTASEISNKDRRTWTSSGAAERSTVIVIAPEGIRWWRLQVRF